MLLHRQLEYRCYPDRFLSFGRLVRSRFAGGFVNSETDVTAATMPGNVSEIRLTESKIVRELLKDLGLLHRHFVVLIDGKRANLNDEIEEGQRVLVLPIIAGG